MRFLRWLVLADRPVALRTEADLTSETERNYTWNFATNLADGALVWFGTSLISATTVLPLFVSKLTPSPLAIGLVAIIAQGAWFLPQLFTANYTERLPRRKPVIVNLGFFLERLPMAFLLLAALLAVRAPTLALLLLFVGYAWFGLGSGAVAPAWHDLIARCFPVERRGRFFGITMFIGAGMGFVGAGASTWVLREFPFPTNFVYLFAGAGLAILLSWIALALVREPVQASQAPRRSNREYLSGIPAILRADTNFRRFVIARSVMAAAGMGSGFLTVSAITRWQTPDSTVGIFTASLLLGQTGGNLAFGFLADRFGHKLSLQAGAVAGAVGYAVAWLSPGPTWYYGVFLLVGVVSSAVLISGILIVMEFSGPARRPTYIGLANSATGVIGTAAPLLGAWLASVSYDWLFAVCLALNLLTAALFRWWVRDPRAA